MRLVELREQREQNLHPADGVKRAVYGVRHHGFNFLWNVRVLVVEHCYFVVTLVLDRSLCGKSVVRYGGGGRQSYV